ncbi:MAG TPA: hypothetical protein VE465_21570 [Streptosporangiaceae bacterium]|jgi:hypothetical protein|nr:hypothetical protein [Streptosporangiaceae bacterium]
MGTDIPEEDMMTDENSWGMVAAGLIGAAAGGTLALAGAGAVIAHLPVPVDPGSPIGKLLSLGIEEATKHGAELGVAAGVATHRFFADSGGHIERFIDGLSDVGILQEMSEEERKDYDDCRLPIEGPPGTIHF